MFTLLRRWAGSKSGNFSQIAALLTVPLIGAVGLAVDYGHALEVSKQLQEAADAAAVGAIADSSPAYAQTALMEDDGPVPAGEKDAINLFNANVRSQWSAEVSEVKAEVRKAGADLTAKVSFTARIPTTFMRILGNEYVDMKGEATSARRTAPFIDFYLLLDNTPSMGVGATTSDISRMVANTPDKCAFACHDLSSANNYYTLAKQLNVALRIDVVREATQRMTDTAADRRAHSNQFRMALYTFGDTATNRKLTKLAPLTSDLKKVNEAADAVDLMSIPYQNFDSDELTDFDGAFAALDKEIDKPGNGTSTKDRQKVVFFVSDGVADSDKPFDCSKPTTKGRCQEPIDLDDCTKLKDRGIRVAVLYTTYLPLPTNTWYNTWIKPFQGQIATNMSACASPGYFFEVSPSEGISEAMEALFLKVISAPRLTG
jgi:Flp pilus assembly protein TadG